MARRKKIWKMIRIFLFAAAIAVMHGMASQNACESDTLEYNKNGVRHHGALRVEAAQLVNHAGEAVQLRGMSSHGLQWYPEYTNCRRLSPRKNMEQTYSGRRCMPTATWAGTARMRRTRLIIK